VVLMIDKTPDDQIVPLIDFLKNNRIMLDLCYKIDNIGGNDNFTAFTNSLFKIYNKKYSAELDVNTFYLPKENLFIWMDKGFAEKITYQLDYKRDENEFSFRWKYRRDFSNPVKVAPFEVVAVNFQTDISFLPLPGNKKVVLMPAFVFAWLINKDNNVTTQAKIDLGIKVAELAFAIYQIKTIDIATTAFMKAIYYINLARTGTNTLLLYEPLTDEIEAYEYGAQFLDAYYKINNVWEIGDFTVNWWLDGSIGYFTVFTQAWDKMVDDNEDTDFITKYPEFYNLVTKIKEGLE